MDDSFTNYIADALTSHIAGSDGNADFILSQGDDLVYVDVEGCSFYLITVKEAVAVVPG